MADDILKVSPEVPIVNIQLDLGDGLQDFALRFDLLAARNLDKEASAEGIDVAKSQKRGEQLDRILLAALTIKHFLWPREHGLDTDQIMQCLSFGSLAYLDQKIAELYKLNGRDLTTNPQRGRGRKRRSQPRTGGSLKPRPDSVSDSASTNSGTPPLPN